jgi:heme exporter protein A
MDKPELTIHNLCFERDEHVLFTSLNCALAAGDVLQIRGSNGSGKSTLLRVIASLIEPSAGTLLWQNKPIKQQLEIYRQQIHYLGHQNSLKRNLTISENLRLHDALNRHSPSHSAIKIALQKVGLSTVIDTLVQHLSAGQARRVSLAKLLLNPVPLWLLDEPLTALDSDGQQYFNCLLQEHLANQGIAIVATHHDLTLNTSIKTIQLGCHHA